MLQRKDTVFALQPFRMAAVVRIEKDGYEVECSPLSLMLAYPDRFRILLDDGTWVRADRISK